MSKNKTYESVDGIIDTKSKLKKILLYESVKYKRKNTRMPWICISENDVLWKYNFLLRKTEYYTNTKNKLMGLLYKIVFYRYRNKHSIYIPLNSFECGLRIMHLGPILVNGRVKAGKDIALHVNTSIVAGGVDEGTPTLDDGVVVGVGAVILGNVTIAKNIAIGANAVVNKSFQEENISIAGIPAKKIGNSGRLEWNKKSKR